MSNTHELHVVPITRSPPDTLPPGACMDPTLCPGLEAVIVDLGVMRSHLERVATQQDLIIAEMRALNVAVASILERLPCPR